MRPEDTTAGPDRMTPGPQILTDRLLLRRWRERDRGQFAALNADPQVMAYFPSTLARCGSDAFIDRIEEHFRVHGFGFWAVQERATGRFLGLTGLAVVGFDARFSPAVEIGWRLARPAWGRGYATEAARAALTYGFETLGLRQIVSFTSPLNQRSQAVMRRLGMTHDPADDFDHPLVSQGHRLRPHVLHRIANPHPDRQSPSGGGKDDGLSRRG